ncbi:Rad51-associated protein Brh2 [Rhodotorula toruloides ATCC 204091]|uniref:Rad51-associated protein Brh2 n=1 Tax=Rhodotorula toruloides TaxID=5286 RepID=A0A0K3CCB5_RHOTO|nr:Rad51-associated protein Brh2 [Rhodotorula toruloides ATCC 204091]KAK4331585.1 Rad51-associated protein Brh2 [Rhodotorula toruloides]PRQ78009.1 Rad51-associated protein Brh2 [Rhodotorula toruloides]
MLPSSDPRGRGLEDDEDEGETVEGSHELANGTLKEGEAGEGADDSGVGLLPDIERSRDVEEGVEAEPPDVDEVEDAEFEGDDMWLGFDDADVGFDQPDTFPSSAFSALPPPSDRLDGATADSDAHDAAFTEPSEPRLSDFGFANVNSLAGGTRGFVFATRKPLVVSEQAMQRMKAMLEAEDHPADPPARPAERSQPVVRTKTPLARPLPLRQPTVPPAPAPPPAATSGLTLAAFGGFATAGGTAVAAPSADAFALAQQRLQDSSSPAAANAFASSSTTAPTAASAFLGFQNAAGRSIDMPSEEAMQRARAHLDAPSSSPPPSGGAPNRVMRLLRPKARLPVPTRDVFEAPPVVGRGSATTGQPTFALPPPVSRAPSPIPIERIGDAMALDTPTALRVRQTSAKSSASDDGSLSAGRRTPLLPLVNGGEKDGMQAKERAAEKDAETASSDTMRSSKSPPPPPVNDTAPSSDTIQSVAAPTPVAPVARRPPVAPAVVSSAPSRPGSFRPPLLSHTATPARRPNSAYTPLHPSRLMSPASVAGSSKPNPLLSQQRRLNFGMTPLRKPHHLANTRTATPGSGAGGKGFKTPWKDGKRPEGLTPMGLKDKLAAQKASVKKVETSVKRDGEKRTSRLGEADLAKREKAKVFDLEANLGSERYDLTFGMRPQTHYYEALQEIGLPDAVLDMDSTSGASYTFPCGRGVADAFSTLQALVCERMPQEKDLVTLPWVKNHWSLILWKLASYVRSRPDLLDERWSFGRVMDQLRYRYEREVNRAERSAIKRIQEQDSPASLPMVLCVSQIRWDEPSDGSGADPDTLVIVGLELTDGWYRIRTNVDRTLKSACERGKIVVGSKIAVMGAKLDCSKDEGSDVLQALGRSTLMITGNSTSLAPWHAKLGFRPEPFVASLASISPAGGLVPLLDIYVDRAFPRGYTELRKGRSGENWGEEEEAARAKEWERGRKRIEAKMTDELEKAGVEEDEIVELLREAVGRYDTAPTSTSLTEEPDEILDRLESAPNKQAIIRKLTAQQVQACFALAQENAQASRYRAVEDLQKELAEKYPPRQVRCFRVLRIFDAREGTRGIKRTAQLTVWDAETFDADFFREGQRFMLSNTLPKGSWKPKDSEIGLATRRDSRWRRI